MFKIDTVLRVRNDHPYWPNKTGWFEFMGGPNGDVVVICTRRTAYTGEKEMICVDFEDVVVDNDAKLG